MCVATDGREDFEGMLVDDQAVKQSFLQWEVMVVGAEAGFGLVSRSR